MKNTITLTKEQHRQLGIQYFNLTWNYIDTENRTQDEVVAMIQVAQASAFHWKESQPKIANLQRSQWQIARVYEILKHKEQCLFHALECLRLTEVSEFNPTKENGFLDFDFAFAFEICYKAYQINDDKENMELYYSKSKEWGEEIDKLEDRDYFFKTLDNTK